MLVSWLLASISEEMFNNVAKCTTASDVWITLQTYFASESKIRISQLSYILHTLQKLSLGINKNVKRMKEIFDALIASGLIKTEGELIKFHYRWFRT